MKKVINIKEIELVTDPQNLKLYNHDVLPQVEDQRVRRLYLDKASTLGNISNVIANIVLDTPSGYKRIQAKVKGLDDSHVWLEDRTLIPIKAIYAVDMV
jgi:hypothetical protein